MATNLTVRTAMSILEFEDDFLLVLDVFDFALESLEHTDEPWSCEFIFDV